MVAISFYNQFMEFVGDNGIDLDNDSFRVELALDPHVFTAADQARASISANTKATANNYTNPGNLLVNVTWVESAGTITFDADDNTWGASGGSITASNAVIYSDTSTAPFVDLLMCNIDFAGIQSAGDGTDFKITFNASGIFTIS